MKDPKRREMFKDLYRLAEYYENPPFKCGDVDGNFDWIARAQKDVLYPFLLRYDSELAHRLAFDIEEEACEKARKDGDSDGC